MVYIKENIPTRKRKIFQLVKRKYFQFELGNWEMAEEEQTYKTARASSRSKRLLKNKKTRKNNILKKKTGHFRNELHTKLNWDWIQYNKWGIWSNQDIQLGRCYTNNMDHLVWIFCPNNIYCEFYTDSFYHKTANRDQTTNWYTPALWSSKLFCLLEG